MEIFPSSAAPMRKKGNEKAETKDKKGEKEKGEIEGLRYKAEKDEMKEEKG